MKKISVFMSMALAVLGLASCSQDRDPVLQTPTEFVLNEPAMQDQYIQLTAGNTLELVASQPNYGYSAIAQYSAEMSLTPDFAEYRELESLTPTLARMSFKQEDVATALCELQGIATEEDFAAKYPDGVMPPGKIYFRAVCELAGVENTRIVSNVVSYNEVVGYFAVPVPGYIYLVGQCEGWAGPTESNAAHYADWRLFEPSNAIGSKVYSGTFNINAGEAMFRFYTKLTGWDADSYGSQVDDNPIEFPEFTDGSFTTAVVKGKGAFSFPNWVGGEMTVTVDMSDMDNITVTCSAGSVAPTVTKYIYLIGNISGWNAPGIENADALKNYRLADSTDSGIYVGEFDVPAGELNFRFALELNEEGWDNHTQIGSQADDANVACSFTNGVFNGTYVPGKGNWGFVLENDAKVSMTVDTNTQTVTYVIE